MQNGKNVATVCENVKVAQDYLDAMAILASQTDTNIHVKNYILHSKITVRIAFMQSG